MFSIKTTITRANKVENKYFRKDSVTSLWQLFINKLVFIMYVHFLLIIDSPIFSTESTEQSSVPRMFIRTSLLIIGTRGCM